MNLALWRALIKNKCAERISIKSYTIFRIVTKLYRRKNYVYVYRNPKILPLLYLKINYIIYYLNLISYSYTGHN